MINILTGVTIALSILCIFLIAKIFRLYNIIDTQNIQIQNLDTFIESMKKVFTDTAAKLREVDVRGSFSADDEVGFVFKVIKATIDDVKDFIQSRP